MGSRELLLSCFRGAVFCFRGAQRSFIMFFCVVAASRKVCAFFLGLGLLLGTFQAGFSLFVRVLDEFVGLREDCCAFLHRRSARAHIFAPAGAASPPTRKQMRSPGGCFPLPRGSLFGTYFVTFHSFRNYTILSELSSRLGESSILRVRGPSKCIFFSLGPPLRKLSVPGGSWQGGHPLEKLERTSGPASCRQSAYRDRHPLRPKRSNPRRCLGTRFGTVGKEPWSSSKAQNIKEDIIQNFCKGAHTLHTLHGLQGFTRLSSAWLKNTALAYMCAFQCSIWPLGRSTRSTNTRS